MGGDKGDAAEHKEQIQLQDGGGLLAQNPKKQAGTGRGKGFLVLEVLVEKHGGPPLRGVIPWTVGPVYHILPGNATGTGRAAEGRNAHIHI